MRRGVKALIAAAVGAGLGPFSAGASPPQWDQVQNIKEAAVHIALLQRQQGLHKAIEFIDACYRTHSLASEYTRAYEACIARDYMLAQALAGFYARFPASELAERGLPNPMTITRAMGSRVAAAFKQYEISPEDAEAFRILVEKNGFPLVVQILFPPKPAGEKDDEPKDGKGEKTKKPKRQ